MGPDSSPNIAYSLVDKSVPQHGRKISDATMTSIQELKLHLLVALDFPHNQTSDGFKERTFVAEAILRREPLSTK